MGWQRYNPGSTSSNYQPTKRRGRLRPRRFISFSIATRVAAHRIRVTTPPFARRLPSRRVAAMALSSQSLPAVTAPPWRVNCGRCRRLSSFAIAGAVSGSTSTLTYDAENRLAAVSGATSASFVYDGDGHRVKSVMAGVSTYYVGNYYEYVTSSTTKKYYYAGGQRVAMRNNNTLSYLLGDHLGSTAITANSNGTLYTEQRYYPWGDTRYNSPATTPTTYQFTGQRKDATGLYFYNARYYDPYLNRFISPDSIIPDPASPQSLNRYSYVFNNPLKYVDSSGHIPVIPLLIAAAIVLIVPASNAHPAPPSSATLGNFPVNSSNGADCTLSLPDCFGNTVKLKDLPGYDVNAPLPEAEFTALASKVAEDLYNHHTPSPGFLAGRGAYDTPFYNGGGRVGILGTMQGIYDAGQQVCVEGLRCSGRSEINYFAQGMWSAAAGESLGTAKGYAYAWKFTSYKETPSADVLYWIEYGYKYYLDWLQRNGYDTYGYVEWLRRYNEEIANAPSIP